MIERILRHHVGIQAHVGDDLRGARAVGTSAQAVVHREPPGAQRVDRDGGGGDLELLLLLVDQPEPRTHRGNHALRRVDDDLQRVLPGCTRGHRSCSIAERLEHLGALNQAQVQVAQVAEACREPEEHEDHEEADAATDSNHGVAGADAAELPEDQGADLHDHATDQRPAQPESEGGQSDRHHGQGRCSSLDVRKDNQVSGDVDHESREDDKKWTLSGQYV